MKTMPPTLRSISTLLADATIMFLCFETKADKISDVEFKVCRSLVSYCQPINESRTNIGEVDQRVGIDGSLQRASVAIVFVDDEASDQPPVYLQIHSEDTGECPQGQCKSFLSFPYLLSMLPLMQP